MEINKDKIEELEALLKSLHDGSVYFLKDESYTEYRDLQGEIKGLAMALEILAPDYCITHNNFDSYVVEDRDHAEFCDAKIVAKDRIEYLKRFDNKHLDKYKVYIRLSGTADAWSDEYYPEPYIMAVDSREARSIAEDFIEAHYADLGGYEYEEFDYKVALYEE